jgi:small subunit ribosomal protein S1
VSSDRPNESFAALFERSQRSDKGERKRGARVGETVQAVVVQVGQGGVFVEMDGHRQGFIETVDLQAPDGTLRVAVGSTLRARVVRVDDEGIRLVPTVEAAAEVGAAVALGAVAGGAPDDAQVKIAVGQVVNGTVDRVENYGIFVQIEGTKGRTGRGLAPTAELAVPRATDLRKAFPLGTKMRVKVIDLAEGRIRLSVRALKDDEERAAFDGFREAEKKAAEPQGFGTLGDLVRKATKGPRK